MRTDAGEIKALLLAQIEALARELVPDGHRAGNYWIGRNPMRADANIGSFWVNLSGQMQGLWHDAATGETGDMLRLIERVHGLRTFPEALKWASEWLRLGSMPAEHVQATVESVAARRAREEKEAAGRLVKARRAAHAIYLKSKMEDFLGSPADAYLRGRGIEVARLGRMPGCLGWIGSCEHRETQTHWPAMVALFTSDDNKPAAIHRTWLSAGGKGKAPVEPARKIWPSFRGAAIRLWRGDSRMSVDQAAKQGLLETLVLCEGVEDGLSMALARPDLRIWCAGSLGNLAEITLPACCDRVVLLADNDWGKPQAQKLFDKAIAALTAQGARVSVARSHVGKDANDALRGER